MADKAIGKLWDKYYNNKKKNKKGEIEMAIKAKNGIKAEKKEATKIAPEKKEIVKKEKQYRYKVRPNGYFTLGGIHVARFGFMPKQELEITSPKPGEIIIRAKEIITA